MKLTRTIFALTLTITLASSQLVGCGGGDSSPCDKFVSASTACARTFADATGTPVPDQGMTCDGDDGSNDAMYDCMAAAYQGVDCSTLEGVMATGTDATLCMDLSLGDGGTGGTGTGGTGTGGTGTGGTGTGGTGTGGTGTGGTGTGGGDNPDTGQIDLATIHDMAVRVSACMHAPANEARDNNLALLYLGDIGAWGGFASAAKDMQICAATAESCEAVLACAGMDSGQTCNPTSQPDSCDGSNQSSCYVADGCGETAVGWTQRMDCSESPQAGLGDNTQCLVDDEGSSVCGAGTCTPGEPSRCEGDVVVDCKANGVLEERDCSLLGETCSAPMETGEAGEESATEPGCTTNTMPTCEDSHCDGDTMVLCIDGAELMRMKCGDLAPGLACSTTTFVDMNWAECRAAESDMECIDGKVTCAGTEARWCIGGKWASVDCATFLDGICTIDESGKQGIFCSSPTWDATVDALDGQAGNAWSCTGGGSGSSSGSGDNPCEAFMALSQQCIDTFEANGGSLQEDMPDDFCDSYRDSPSERDLYNCLVDSYTDADCTTMQGLMALGEASLWCEEHAGDNPG